MKFRTISVREVTFALLKNFNIDCLEPLATNVKTICCIPNKKAISPYVDLSKMNKRTGNVKIPINLPDSCGVMKYIELDRNVLFFDILFRINEIFKYLYKL